MCIVFFTLILENKIRGYKYDKVTNMIGIGCVEFIENMLRYWNHLTGFPNFSHENWEHLKSKTGQKNVFVVFYYYLK